MNDIYIEKVLKNHSVKFTKFCFNNKTTFFCYIYSFSNAYDIITGNEKDGFKLIEDNELVTNLTNKSLYWWLGY